MNWRCLFDTVLIKITLLFDYERITTNNICNILKIRYRKERAAGIAKPPRKTPLFSCF